MSAVPDLRDEDEVFDAAVRTYAQVLYESGSPTSKALDDAWRHALLEVEDTDHLRMAEIATDQMTAFFAECGFSDAHAEQMAELMVELIAQEE